MKSIGMVLGFLLLLLSNACSALDLAGSIIPPLPDGWKNEGAACVAKCEFAIGVLGAPNGFVLYLGKSAPTIDPQKPRWIVTDQITYPKGRAGHQVVYSVCERNGKLDETIIAIVKTTDTEWYSNVVQAYKANLTTERFEELTTDGVRCLNEGWGDV